MSDTEPEPADIVADPLDPAIDLTYLLREYGDLADVPLETLEAARDRVAAEAWSVAVSDAQARMDTGRANPFGGLADLADRMTLASRPGAVERYRLLALSAERAMEELGEDIATIAEVADNYADRDPARGDDAEERKRLVAERESLQRRLVDQAATVARKAARLREML